MKIQQDPFLNSAYPNYLKSNVKTLLLFFAITFSLERTFLKMALVYSCLLLLAATVHYSSSRLMTHKSTVECGCTVSHFIYHCISIFLIVFQILSFSFFNTIIFKQYITIYFILNTYRNQCASLHGQGMFNNTAGHFNITIKFKIITHQIIMPPVIFSI